MTDEKQPIDWTEIERDFRTGSMSVREMAKWYGVSEGAIRKRAKAGGWERNGTQARTQPERANPEPEKVYVGTVLTPENATPEAIVGRGRNLVLRMLDELDATTTRNGELEALIVSSTDEGDANGQRAALMQAVSLKQRADVLKALATAAKTLAESGAPAGVKQARQEAGERVAKGSGKFASPAPPPRLVQ
jgi:hypothetical protein